MIVLAVLFVCMLVLMACVVWLILALRESTRTIERLLASRSGLGRKQEPV